MKHNWPQWGVSASLALGLAITGAVQSQAAITNTVRAENMTLTGAPDPGGIVGDGSNNTDPGGNTYTLWDAPGSGAGNEVLVSTYGGNAINSRGEVKFTLNQALADGDYTIQALIQPNNIFYNNNGTPGRNQHLGFIIGTSGGAKFNGVVNGSSSWFVAQPNYNDSGAPPWKTLTLAGGTNADFTTVVWNSLPQAKLEGVDGGTGKFYIRVLDGTGQNYGFVNVESFNFIIPEPGSAALVAVGLGLLALRRAGR